MLRGGLYTKGYNPGVAERMRQFNGDNLKRYVLGREDYYVRLMRDGDESVPLELAADLNCYNISVLIAYELVRKIAGVEVFTMDGRAKGLSRADDHEVLGVRLAEGFYFIDATIWQIKANEEHIRIGGPFLTLEEMEEALEAGYGGRWNQKAIPQSFLTTKGAKDNRFLIRSRAKRRGYI